VPDVQALGALDFVAVDWGTSRLRAWAMGEDGAVLAHAASKAGMGSLKYDDFEPALLRLIGSWLPDGRVTPVVACGMVGADGFATWLRADADGFGIRSALYKPGDGAREVAAAARALVAGCDREARS
jgi:2-keto-3-deoxy-6-phosphogluconate aldolase